jgi:hypothetical protein
LQPSALQTAARRTLLDLLHHLVNRQHLGEQEAERRLGRILQLGRRGAGHVGRRCAVTEEEDVNVACHGLARGRAQQTLVAMPVMRTVSMPRERRISSRSVLWKAPCLGMSSRMSRASTTSFWWSAADSVPLVMMPSAIGLITDQFDLQGVNSA